MLSAPPLPWIGNRTAAQIAAINAASPASLYAPGTRITLSDTAAAGTGYTLIGSAFTVDGGGNSPLNRLQKAVASSTGLAITPYSITPVVTQIANGGLPDGLTTIPSGTTSGNANGSTPSWRSSGLFSTANAEYYVTYINVSGGSNRSYPAYTPKGPVTVNFTGRYLYALTSFAGTKWTLLVDGKVAVNYTTTAGTSNAFLCFDFGLTISGVVTLITDAIIGAFATSIEGVLTAVTRGVTVANMSDSYGGFGTPSISAASGMLYDVMLRCGAKDISVDYYGGSGYIKTNGGTDTLLRLSNALATSPDVLWTQFGINDPLPNTYTELQARVLAYYQAARASNGALVLITQASWVPDETKAYDPSMNAQLVKSYVLAALDSVGGPWIFIDNTTGGWRTSNGKFSAGSGRSWQTGYGGKLSFTAALTAATTGTLSSGFIGSTGAYTLIFSDGSSRTSSMTQGSTTVTWTGAVTASAICGCYRTSSPGNAYQFVASDFTHPDSDPLFGLTGVSFLANTLTTSIRAAVYALTA